MKMFRTCMIVSICGAAMSLVAVADEKSAPSKEAAFDKIKALAGDWMVTKGPEDHGPKEGTVSYKVTAGGSAVEETLFAGTEHEMVTMYYMNGDNLELTHYCMLQNRPHMRAEPQTSPDVIVFKCPDGDNPKIEKETHMHGVTFTFVDADHLKTEWTLFKDGQPSGTHGFELTRKKKAN